MNAEQPLDEVVESLAAVGVHASGGGDSRDLILDFDGRELAVEVTRASVVSPAQVRALPEAPPAHVPHGSSAIRMLVAERISESARGLLTELGWSWLDLRGHVHLRADGLLVDARFRPRADVRLPRSAGRAWREVCFALLREPTIPVGVRPLARRLDLSPAAVSGALAQMRGASLLDRRDSPLVPELFWLLAEHWQIERVALARPPELQDADLGLELGLELGLDGGNDILGLPGGTSGWALTDTLAAAAYGAPIGVGSGWPPDFYVPDAIVLRRAVRVLGRASDWDDRAATVAVAPVRQVCQLRRERPDNQVPGVHWLLADPLAVALDLAQDASRGVEVLRDWTPPAWAARVWA